MNRTGLSIRSYDRTCWLFARVKSLSLSPTLGITTACIIAGSDGISVKERATERLLRIASGPQSVLQQLAKSKHLCKDPNRFSALSLLSLVLDGLAQSHHRPRSRSSRSD